MAFSYKDNELYVDETRITDIVNDVATPVYVYSLHKLIKNFTVYQSLPNSLICFAVKANSNLSILRAISKLGGGADVVSIGEMKLALTAGIAAEKIVFSGVGKTRTEIVFAVEQQIHQINVESIEELQLINEICSELGKKICVSVRLNPDVDAHTHYKITTGTKVNKFGLSNTLVEGINVTHYPNIDFIGISTHIGSSISSLDVFRQMIDAIKAIIPKLVKQNWNIRRIDAGGGLGIPYAPGEKFPSIQEYVSLLENTLGPTGYEIICEPGRSVVGDCGILVSQVVYNKVSNENITHVILDAGMNDFARPAVYGVTHQIIPIRKNETAKIQVDIVGPVCETGDTFARNYQLQKLNSGDLVAICDVGAYGMSLASTYNSRPLPAEVLANGNTFSVIRERGTYEALLAQTKICENILLD